MNDLFKKGDILTEYLRDFYNIYGTVNNGYNDYYRSTKKTFQVGNKILRKRKLLELNSPLITEVELFDYSKGEVSMISYDKLQDFIKIGKYQITGREKKKIKL